MSPLLDLFKRLSPLHLAAVAGLVIAVFGFFLYLIFRASPLQMSILFSDVDPAEGAKIVAYLESNGIPVDLKGSVISIPSDKVARAKMDLAQEGLPTGGVVGYEVFDRGDFLSTSTALLDINKGRALEGELSKSIKTIGGVLSARVHLGLSKRELFASRPSPESSGSVVLKMKLGAKLNESQIQAIQHLVSSAVPHLPAEKISIIDDRGTLLARGYEREAGVQGMMHHQELRSRYEAKMTKALEGMIEKTVGLGKVRVEVSTEMNFDHITVSSEKYDPNGQVIRSVNNSDENSDYNAQNQSVSIQNSLPQTQSKPQDNDKNSSKNKRNQENTHYEISKTIENQTKEIGSLKTLSVAILVDGTYKPDSSGHLVYTPRPKEELEKIKILAQTAVGYKADRGDKIEVMNMPFARLDQERELVEQESPAFFSSLNLTHLIELAILSVVGIVILLMVIRPFLMRFGEKSFVSPDTQAIENMLSPSPSFPLEGMPSPANGESSHLHSLNSLNPLEEDVVPAHALTKIINVIHQKPEEALSILRTWMSEELWNNRSQKQN